MPFKLQGKTIFSSNKFIFFLIFIEQSVRLIFADG